ncbi:MAG TPA: sugar phosphate isomerase/epimerase [Terriglobia bacterium]
MSRFNRREFLRGSAAALAVGALGRVSRLAANPLGLPIGLELYTVRQQFTTDAKRTLAQVAAIGYQEVELFSFAKYKPAELKQMVEAAGLKAPSGHCSAQDLAKDTSPLIDSFRDAGVSYMICAFPGHRPGTAQSTLQVAGQGFNPHFSEDDYKWMAETFNQVGASCQKAGLQFGYHNHNLDFIPFEDGQLALDYLLQQTDPKLVQLEMDCYWVSRAGKDPLDYMKRYPGRIPILHLKDMKPGVTPTTDISKGGDAFTEVGRGTIDWKRIFQAAPEAGVKHYFVEQDKCDGPPMESAKISYEYLKNLQV